ncbi:hypothetical protein [Chondromyces crocatus]|uniref:Uncharacterized protein n=1 Tax=Chondromyces crocatus TaxID=52 RepID=A0A0K1ECE1_CHOCO|nr:hypothetical protein [Chondromyces crocatus]AKT38551.1 uncharacterized protein CMC5_026980 [Chondromyces crocatus]
MNHPDQHPSFLELDRLALDAATSPETQAHVAACPTCQRHLASRESAPLADLPALQQRARAAAAARDLTGPRRIVQLPAVRRLLWAGPSLAAAAAVILFVLFRPQVHVDVPHDPATSGEFTTIKGSASALLHIKRGEHLFVWDGLAPVQPGDKLRLEVAADGFTHVTVLAAPPPSAPGAPPAPFASSVPQAPAPVVLYSAAIDPERPVALPKAWEVDDSPGPESLVVVLSAAPLDPTLALDALRTPRDGVWIQRFDLSKLPRQEGTP